MTTHVEWAGLWHPIAANSDLPFRHVFQGQLLGRELAVWRADDDYVNVWENRCLHRGVRLSLGINDGRELKCQYHGWRYSNRTAGCTYIPAHPAGAPARTITNRTLPTLEKYGLVWLSLAPEAPMPEVEELADGDGLLVLRGMATNAPAGKILASLTDYRFQPSDAIDGGHATVRLIAESDLSLTLRANENGSETLAAFFVQPVDSSRSVIRGVLDRGAEGRKRIAILGHHNERLAAVRDRVFRPMRLPSERFR